MKVITVLVLEDVSIQSMVLIRRQIRALNCQALALTLRIQSIPTKLDLEEDPWLGGSSCPK